MSQTQKYKPEVVEKIISSIEKYSMELNELLASDGDYSQKVEKALEILTAREVYFKEFENIPKEISLDLYFRNNHNKWLTRINKILELEKINLDIIEKNMKLQSEKLKDINKQKKLLLYMKREV
ncbi:MAG: hypothetical protein N2560_05295 [Ignavibacteria bacterium]|nr:hypothetical protein [Ignavibacteria bacterium]